MSAQPRSSDAISISKSSLRRAGLAAGGLVALVVVVVLIVAIARNVGGSSDPLASAINSSEYQAVFLSNGQVYFGKMSAPGGEFYYLRHVYYLQSQASRRGTASNRTLVPLTRDINTPEDLMVINRRSILFVENLNPAGCASKLLSGHRCS